MGIEVCIGCLFEETYSWPFHVGVFGLFGEWQSVGDKAKNGDLRVRQTLTGQLNELFIPYLLLIIHYSINLNAFFLLCVAQPWIQRLIF